MRRLLLTLIAIAAATLPAAAAAQPAQAPAARDWTRNVVATAEGGVRMGNPEAAVKVIEYLSLTCGHCAEFARAGTPRLIGHYVRSGRVSLEYRNFVLNPVDLTASLLVRCGAPADYFRMAERLFATQNDWVGRVQSVIAAQGEQINALPLAERLSRVAAAGGLTAIAAQHNVPAARARQCLADQTGLDRLAQIYQAAEALGVQGTPTFLINGTKANVNSWPEIEALIQRAGG